jgi:phospholipase/carboxylesterase
MRTSRIAELEVRIAGGTDREGGGTGPVVVLLHGFGAPGDDLVPLLRMLNVPNHTRFVLPAAPLEPVEFAAFGGRAWWPIDTLALQQAAAQGRERERVDSTPPGIAAASAQVTALLDCIERDFNVSGEQILLGGFSQGAMLACDVALRSKRRLAGLVLLSATLLCKDEWQPLMAARAGLPVLQTHGLRDPLLSHALACELRDLLLTAGVALEWLEFPGGHELPAPVLRALGAFIAQHALPR